MSYQPHPEDMSLYSDMYKDAHGFRPRHEMIFHSEEDFRNVIKSLEKEIVRQIEEQDNEEEMAIAHFNKEVEMVMDICSAPWKRAVEILMEAEEDIYAKTDIEDFLCGWGIFGMRGYEIIKRFREA